MVFRADMLEHPHAHHAVEDALDIAIVLQADIDRQIRTEIVGVALLLLRNGETHDLAAMVHRHVTGETAPAATDVQHAHAGVNTQLAADEFHLEFLRGGEVARAVKIRARVLHRGIEHGSEKVVPEVVVTPPDHAGAGFALQVQQDREGHLDDRAEVRADACVDAAPDRTVAKLLEIVAIPPRLHVGLTEAQRAFAEHPAEEPLVIHPDVARPHAVDFDIRLGEEVGHDFFGAGDFGLRCLPAFPWLGGDCRGAHGRRNPGVLSRIWRKIRRPSSDCRCSHSMCGSSAGSSRKSGGGSGSSGTISKSSNCSSGDVSRKDSWFIGPKSLSPGPRLLHGVIP